MTEPANGDVGAWLRAAREQAGLSLRQIADSTKLSVVTLKMLECNRVSQLPGGIYRRAIVRSYASEVGLDPEVALRTFLTHHPQNDDTAISAVPEPPRPPRNSLFKVVTSIVGALIPVAAGLVYLSLPARGSARSGRTSRGPA